MEEENLSIKTLEGVKSFINNLPNVTYGANVIPYLNIEGYGAGQIAYDSLQKDFENLDLSTILESSDLNTKIKKQKKELTELEKKHSKLVSIFGEDGGASEGTLTRKLLETVENEISELINKRDNLLNEVEEVQNDSDNQISAFEKKVTDADKDSKLKIVAIEQKTMESENTANIKVKNAISAASGKVRIIEQFSDFLAETNSNMQLYHYVILLLVIGVGTTIALSVPDLLASFTSYNTFITKLGAKATSWQILNFAFGILIVKLPWALCLTAVFTGMYTLLKGLLTTYEKINQDKRNMSAIYAVSANIAESLNEYGLSIATHDHEDDDNGELYTILRAPNKEVLQKRESLKWNQIMNYFEGMQHQKAEVIIPEEESSNLKFASEIANKLLEKIPSA